MSSLFTGTVGVNQTAYDTSYNASPLDCYTRATDSTTFGGQSVGNNTYSGGDNDVMWSKNGDFVGTALGGYVYILNVNTTGNCAQVLNTGNITGSGGIAYPGAFGFSRVTDNVFYNVQSYSQIYKTTIKIPYNITNTHTLLFDLATCPALASLTGWSWSGILGVSNDDQRFSLAMSNLGGQGTGLWQVVYDQTLGCATMNTSTGAYWAFGATSQTGTLATSGNSCWGGQIHDSQFSGDGVMTIVSESASAWTQGACAGVTGGTVLQVWQAGTANTQFCSSNVSGPGGLYCGGHESAGTSKILDEESTSAPDSTRALSNVLAYAQYQTGTPWATHGAWPQPDQADDYPWVNTPYGLTTSQGSGCANGPNWCPIAGGNAITASYPSGTYPPGQARTYFGHTYSCNIDNGLYALCPVPTGADWSSGTVYTTSSTVTVITPTCNNAGGYSFEATVAGTGGGSCPTFPQTVGNTVSDGGATLVNLGVAGAGVGDYGFGCQYSIMSVSQDGHWAMFASGMLMSLGIDSVNHARCDVFIVHLQ